MGGQGKRRNTRRNNLHQRHFEKPYGNLLLWELPTVYTYIKGIQMESPYNRWTKPKLDIFSL